jgi:hypothetical protein
VGIRHDRRPKASTGENEMKQRIKIEIEFIDNSAELNGGDSKQAWLNEVKRFLNNYDLSEKTVTVEVKPE